MEKAVIKGTVALVSQNELTRKVDRRALKLLGCSDVVVLPSGARAVEYIPGKNPSLVLASGDTEDMDSYELLYNLRKAGRNLPPVVLVTSENHEQAVIDAIVAGCSGYVLRPYTLGTFRRHIEQARSIGKFLEIEVEQLGLAKQLLDDGEFDEAIAEYGEVLGTDDEAQQYFNKGIEALVKKQYGKAIIAFKRALKICELFAEAYKGMAEAYKGKGEMDKYEENLKRAAEIFAQQDRFEETKKTFAEILKIHTTAMNPYNTLGVTLRKHGDYTGAINAYMQGIALTPLDENIHYNIAKAYHASGNDDLAYKAIVEALDLNPNFLEARRLKSIITGEAIPRDLPRDISEPYTSPWKTVLDD